MKKINKRLLTLMLAAAMVMGTVGCSQSSDTDSSTDTSDSSSSTTDSADDGEPVEITMWGWNADDMEAIFAAYVEDTGANVTLNYVSVDTTEAFQKLQTTVSAGLELPDIVPSESSQRGTMIALDIWEDLSADPYNFDTSITFDYLIPLCSNEDDELVCLPWDITTAAMAYKKDLTEEYFGTSDPDELEAMFSTWDEFEAAGIQLQADTDGEIYMFASIDDIATIASGQNPNDIILDGVLDLTDSIIPTLELAVSFRDNSVCDTISSSSTAYAASYSDDTHIFYPCASWSPTYQILPNDPDADDDWGLMIPPEGCFSWGGSAHMIPEDAENKMEAFELISWLISEDGTVIQNEICDSFSASSTAYDDSDFGVMTVVAFGEQNLGEVLFVDAMENIEVRGVTEYDTTLQDAGTLVYDALMNDFSMTLEDAIEMYETEVRNKAPELE